MIQRTVAWTILVMLISGSVVLAMLVATAGTVADWIYEC